MSKAQELSNITGNEPIETEEIITVKEVPGTPFKTVTQNGKTLLTLGKYKLEEAFETEDEALKYLHENKYNIVLKMIMIVNETTK